MSFQIGRSYGSYEIIDVLHSSREGVTYKVRNRLASRLEAMRVLPGNAHNDQEQIERFLREIRVHAAMLHPNIVSFYSAAELENRLVMTSELVEGVTMAERLELGAAALERRVPLHGAGAERSCLRARAVCGASRSESFPNHSDARRTRAVVWLQHGKRLGRSGSHDDRRGGGVAEVHFTRAGERDGAVGRASRYLLGGRRAVRGVGGQAAVRSEESV